MDVQNELGIHFVITDYRTAKTSLTSCPIRV